MSNCVYGSSSGISYCAASSLNHWFEYIVKVDLNTGSKSSLGSTYSDYTGSVFTTLSLGQQYTLRVTGKTNINRRECVRAWIDFNQDGDFSDSGEEIDMGCHRFRGEYTFSKTFTVPSIAEAGNTRMRVALRRHNPPPSCGTFHRGEVEDYTINIESPLYENCPSILNGGFENGTGGWIFGGNGDHKISSDDKHSGSYSALIGFKDSPNVVNGKDYVYQTITVPHDSNATLSFYYRFYSFDTCSYDSFNVKIRDNHGNVKSTVIKECYEEWDDDFYYIWYVWGMYGIDITRWKKKEIDLRSYAGQTIQIYFEVENGIDRFDRTWVYIDDVKIVCESQFCGGIGQTCCANNKCGTGLSCKNNRCVTVPRGILEYQLGDRIRNPDCTGLFCGFGLKDFLPITVSLINIGKTTRDGQNATEFGGWGASVLLIVDNPRKGEEYFYLSPSNNYGKGDFDSTPRGGPQPHRDISSLLLVKKTLDEDTMARSDQIYYRVKSSDTSLIIMGFLYDDDGEMYNPPDKSIYVKGIGFWEGLFQQLEPVGDGFRFFIFDYNCPDLGSCAFEVVTLVPITKVGKAVKITQVKGGGGSSTEYIYEFIADSNTLVRFKSKSRNLDVSLLYELEKRGVNLQKLSDNVGYINGISKKANGDIIISAERYVKNVELYYPNSGSAFISSIRATDPGRVMSKGEIAERASDIIMKERGWSKATGFLKENENQRGIDGIYFKDGKYCFVESKFMSDTRNIHKEDLGIGYGARQMSDKWIEGALEKMIKERTITPDLYKELINALDNGNVEKELIIIRNAADNGKTIGKCIAQDVHTPDLKARVNLDRVTIINLGGTIVE